jgi:hypothetical protein
VKTQRWQKPPQIKTQKGLNPQIRRQQHHTKVVPPGKRKQGGAEGQTPLVAPPLSCIYILERKDLDERDREVEKFDREKTTF